MNPGAGPRASSHGPRIASRSWCLVLALLAAVLDGGCAPPPPAGWSGYAEGEYVLVAPAIAGTLAELAVQRGGRVEAGDPLFALDADAERAARAEAAARLDAARAQLANATKARRPQEQAVTRAQREQARVQAELAAAELQRRQSLVDRGFVSRAALDELRAAERQSRARVAELDAAVQVAALPARSDEIAAALALVQAAEESLRQADWRQAQKLRSSPAGARVADLFFRPGEWVQAGQPVVSLLPPGNTKARFFVPESEVGAIRPGDPVLLSCDGCGTPIPARVSFIAPQAEFTPPVIYSNAQRSRLVFMVEARPDPADGERLRPGQPLDVQRARARTP